MTTPHASAEHAPMPPLGKTKSRRRHDFDALRAFAMLLGIALHAGLAFAPIPWLAMNDATSPAIGLFIEVLHVFRLPIFFLMSGFFSAMLLSRRGIAGFLTQRSKRIALPLLLGTLTIVPAMWGVIIGGHALQQMRPPPTRAWAAPEPTDVTMWSAAAAGDLDEVRALARDGTPVNAPDPRFGTLPLAWAATGDHDEIVAFLLDRGADPNQTMIDDNTPMHTACFFGANRSFALMLAAGGDPTRPNTHAETPVDATRHDEGAVAFIANLLGVEADFERVESGREKILASLDSASATPSGRSQAMARLVSLLTGELFMHLWFLWQLCWLTCGLVAVRLVTRRLPWKRVPEIAVATPLCLLALVPLTTLTQSWQANFGPDTSAAFIPAPHVLAHYAVFFGFGAVMHASSRAADRLGRVWWAHLVVATISCVLALQLLHNHSAPILQGLNGATRDWLGALTQSVFVWTTAIGLMGLVRRTLDRPSTWIRYVADSSYWLYVVHLPIILAGQFALAYVSLPPAVEFAILTTTTTVVLLLSYQWLVRYTWIGRLLNGRRTRPSSKPASAGVTGRSTAAEPTDSRATGTHASGDA